MNKNGSGPPGPLHGSRQVCILPNFLIYKCDSIRLYCDTDCQKTMFQNPSQTCMFCCCWPTLSSHFHLGNLREKSLLFLVYFWVFFQLNSSNDTFIRVSFQNLLNMDIPAKFSIIHNNKFHKSVSVFHESYSNERKLKLIGNRGKSSQGTCLVLDALPQYRKSYLILLPYGHPF